MTSLAQPVLSKSNGVSPFAANTSPCNPEDVRFQVISDYLHDLRTPLVALRGYSRMVLEERAGSLNTAQKEYLGIVVENTNRVVRVLNELAQLASLEPLAFKVVDARELVRALLAQWQPRLVSRSVRLKEVLPAEFCLLWGDQQRLREAFEELLSKLVGSFSPGAEIVVEVSHNRGTLQIRFSGSQETVWGIPAAPETSAGPSDRVEGLSMAESIIRLHGGHTEIEKGPDHRANFNIVLPACSSKEFPEGESQQ